MNQFTWGGAVGRKSVQLLLLTSLGQRVEELINAPIMNKERRSTEKPHKQAGLLCNQR